MGPGLALGKIYLWSKIKEEFSDSPLLKYRVAVRPFNVTRVGLQNNLLRLRELVAIISKQQVTVPEQKLRALLSWEGFMQPGPGSQPAKTLLVESTRIWRHS